MAISDELRKLVDPNNECCCEHCLSNKCKEWAYSNGYDLVSSVGNFNCGKHKGSCMLHDDVNRDYTNCYTGDTEPEAIFKACEWILKDKR